MTDRLAISVCADEQGTLGARPLCQCIKLRLPRAISRRRRRRRLRLRCIKLRLPRGVHRRRRRRRLGLCHLVSTLMSRTQRIRMAFVLGVHLGLRRLNLQAVFGVHLGLQHLNLQAVLGAHLGAQRVDPPAVLGAHLGAPRIVLLPMVSLHLLHSRCRRLRHCHVYRRRHGRFQLGRCGDCPLRRSRRLRFTLRFTLLTHLRNGRHPLRRALRTRALALLGERRIERVLVPPPLFVEPHLGFRSCSLERLAQTCLRLSLCRRHGLVDSRARELERGSQLVGKPLLVELRGAPNA